MESEKATFEINAEKAGILHTNAKEDDTLNIGDVVGSIDDTAEKPAGLEAPKVEKASEEKKQTADAPKQDSKQDIKATPVAAAMIADKKVDE